jgi:hypothetical protein
MSQSNSLWSAISRSSLSLRDTVVAMPNPLTDMGDVALGDNDGEDDDDAFFVIVDFLNLAIAFWHKPYGELGSATSPLLPLVEALFARLVG